MKKIFHKKWIWPLVIFLLALILRLVAAFKVAWRPDEIVYVDWLGTWFSSHFLSYFLQFFHHNYPIQSNTFGNPPFGMWTMSLGIWLAKVFGLKLLLGARLINVFLGSVSAVLIFWIGKKWFSFTMGLAASLAFSLLPIMVTNNGTAYLETLLIVLILVSFEMFLRIIEKPQTKDYVFLGLSLGLAILTKFVAVPIAIFFLILVPFFAKKTKSFGKLYILFSALIVIVPIALWAGLRDPTHISSMIHIYKNELNLPYPLAYSFPVFQYYGLMLIGILPPIVVIAQLIMVFVIIRNLIAKKWFDYKAPCAKSAGCHLVSFLSALTSLRQRPLGVTRRYKKEITLLALIAVCLAYDIIFTGYGGGHQLLVAIPFVLFLAAIGWEKFFLFLALSWQKLVLVILSLACLVLPLTAFRPEFWSQYSSSFVGGTDEAYKLYIVGVGGEGVPEIADWINKNTPENSRTAVVAYDWLIKKYLVNRSATSLFLEEGIGGAMARGADYIVVPRQFMEGRVGKTALELSKLQPVYVFKVKGIVVANVYSLDYSRRSDGSLLNLGRAKDWELKKTNSVIDYEIRQDELKIYYVFNRSFSEGEVDDCRFSISSKNKISLRDRKGVYIELYGDGNEKSLDIYLTGDDNSTLSYGIVYDWKGWKKIFIPFELFHFESTDSAISEPDLKQNYNFNFLALAKIKMSGEVILRNIQAVSFNKDDKK